MLGKAAVEAGEGTERFGAFTHLRAVQPDPERPPHRTAAGRDAVGQLLLGRSHFVFGEYGEPHVGDPP